MQGKPMIIKPLASGSTGNCYMVDDGHTKVLLEVGISWKRVQQALNFKTSEIGGVIVSHGHSDHSGYAKDAMKAGIDVYALQSTIDALGLSGHRIHAIKAHESFKVGSWTVLPFDVEHDVEALGFLLGNADGERLLYLTDTPYSKYRFEGLSYIMVECNFISDILSKNILSGNLPSIVGHRVRRNHFSLENLISMLKANDLSRCREVWLLHLSDGNSDEAMMRADIQKLTGIPTYIA
jgi:phosphoribosyl 1,2-cyclic phosphodiesterase